jgi:hypothetical protein
VIDELILKRINAPTKDERLSALQTIAHETRFPQMNPRFINNHIHTTYSFSPYSPAAAVYAARNEGLCTAGIVDHDSMGGAMEFVEAGKILHMPVTVGIEARVSMKGTPFERLRANSPDQTGISYMVLHAVPHQSIPTVQAYFAPLREHRNLRNRQMLEGIKRLTGMDLDFERDVLPLSMAHDGGTVTERHLMQALARRENPKGSLLEEYDRIGQLKMDFIPRVYVDATDECPGFDDFIAFCDSTGGILAYPYLGDVTKSVTGDKKAQKFEDENLDLLFQILRDHAVKAVTYMPTRNSDAQLDRLRTLCDSYGMMQISGEDINSPRQSFVIEKMKEDRFSNLIQSTWHLIEHENGGITP